MFEGAPRFMLALAIVVALAVVFVAVTDYLHPRREVESHLSVAVAPPPVDPPANAAKAPEKTTPKKPKPVQTLSPRFYPGRGPQPVAAYSESPFSMRVSGSVTTVVSEASTRSMIRATEGAGSSGTGRNPGLARNSGSLHNAEGADGDQVVEDAVMRRSERVRSRLNSRRDKQALSPPSCVPLPNGTDAADVDAHYYQSWAREYSCPI